MGLFQATPIQSIFQTTAALPQENPLFGVNPSGGRMMYGVGQGLGSYSTSPLGQQMAQQQLAALQRAGLPLGSDPRAWTPQEAQDQTKVAIAKIATVNPELAKELAAKSEGNPHADGGSFWDSLKNLAGDIIHPALSIGGKLLDIISRPAHIIPELLIHNDKPWYSDIGDALSGNGKSTWADVLKQWGVHNTVLAGITGFALDVATDPLTYFTLGGGAGIHAAEGAESVARTVASKWGAKLAVTAGTFTDGKKAEAVLQEGWRVVSSSLKADRAKFTPEAVNGLLGLGFSGVRSDIAATQAELATKLFDIMRAKPGIRAIGKEGITLSDGKAVSQAEIRGFLHDITHGQPFTRQNWLAAKAAAGQEGGARFRYAIPFTNLRYLSPAMPFSEKLNFSLFRQTFSGQLGITRLTRAVTNGVEGVSFKDISNWMEDGWTKAVGENANLKAFGSAFNVGTRAYTFSEQLGKITAQFAPHALAFRGGLLGYYAARDAVHAQAASANFLREIAWSWRDPNTNHVYNQTDFLRRLHSLTGLAFKDSIATATPEDHAKMMEFLAAIPRNVRDGDQKAFRFQDANDLGAYFDERPEVQAVLAGKDQMNPDEFTQAIEGFDSEKRRAINAWNGLNDNQREGMAMLGDLSDNVLRELTANDVMYMDVRANLEDAPHLQPTQAARWQGYFTPESLRRDLYAEHFDGASPLRRDVSGFGPEDVVVDENTDVAGVHLSIDAQGEKAVAAEDGTEPLAEATRARVRVNKPLVLDETLASRADPDRKVYAEILNDARDAISTMGQQADSKAYFAGIFGEDYQRKTLGDLVTAGLQQRGFDSVVTKLKDGGTRLTVFDAANVKAVKDDSVRVWDQRGFDPREWSKELRAFLKGEHPDETPRYIFGVRMPLASKRRTIEKSFSDAEQQIRQELIDQGYSAEKLKNMPIFERDPLKAFDSYFKRAAEDVGEASLGRAAERMLTLSDMVSPALGSPVAVQRYRFQVQDGFAQMLAKNDKLIQQNYARAFKAYNTYLDRAHVGASQMAERLGRFRAAVEVEQNRIERQATRAGARGQERLGASLQAEARGQAGRARQARAASREAFRAQGQAIEALGGRNARVESLRANLGKVSAEDEAAMNHLFAQATKVLDEANRTYYQAHAEVAAVKPALVGQVFAEGKTGMVPLHIPGLAERGFHMPAYMAAEFHRAWGDRRDLSVLQREWRKHVLGPWKRMATYLWPGFHVRNFFGAWFNNFIGGVNEQDYWFARRVMSAVDGKKWAGENVLAKDWKALNLGAYFGGRKDLTYDELGAALYNMGMGRASTTVTAGVTNALEGIQGAVDQYGLVRGFPGRALRRYSRAAQGVGSWVEDFHRIAGWGGGMRQFAGDPRASRAFVMMRQGDYEDFTDTEEFVRDLVPFYKWIRTNTPYQLHMLAENPALMTLPGKVTHAAYETQGYDQNAEENVMPSWMKEQFRIPLPGGKSGAMRYLLMQLPNSDLYKGLNDYLSGALPVVMPFIESYGINKKLFSGAPLTGKQVPLAAWADLPGVRDLLVAMKVAKQDVNGKVLISDQLNNILTGFPIYSRFQNWVTADPQRVSQRMTSLVSGIFGMRPTAVGPHEITNTELQFYNMQVVPLLDQLRSQGVQFPDKNSISPAVYTALGLKPPAPPKQGG